MADTATTFEKVSTGRDAYLDNEPPWERAKRDLREGKLPPLASADHTAAVAADVPHPTGASPTRTQKELCRRIGTEYDSKYRGSDGSRSPMAHTRNGRRWERLSRRDTSISGAQLFATEIRDTVYRNVNANGTMVRSADWRGVTFEKGCSGSGMHITKSLLIGCDLGGLGTLVDGSLKGTILGPGTTLRGLLLTNTDMRHLKFLLPGESTAISAKDFLDRYDAGTEKQQKQMRNLLYNIFKDVVWSEGTPMDPELRVLLFEISREKDGPLPSRSSIKNAADLKKELENSPLFLEYPFTHTTDANGVTRGSVTILGKTINYARSQTTEQGDSLEQLIVTAEGFDYERLKETERALFKRLGMYEAFGPDDPLVQAGKRQEKPQGERGPIGFSEQVFPYEAFLVIAMFAREARRGNPEEYRVSGEGSDAARTMGDSVRDGMAEPGGAKGKDGNTRVTDSGDIRDAVRSHVRRKKQDRSHRQRKRDRRSVDDFLG
ncbi:hypothetical protein MRY87_08850 [bacterium]|nr:hypothetical protein [bacterium]